jgi:hypothetical protein
MNPREREARSKAAVAVVTACYVDLDLTDGESQETALAAVTDGDAPLPSFVVNSGYGLHVVYLLRVPSRDKATWARTQKALARRYSALGADPKVAGDESRVLRLVPYRNRKMSPDGVPTSIVYESEYRYELAELARALAPEQDTPFSRRAETPRPPPAGRYRQYLRERMAAQDKAEADARAWGHTDHAPALHARAAAPPAALAATYRPERGGDPAALPPHPPRGATGPHSDPHP